LGVSGWLKALLNTAFLSEYGWECERQSALNMLTVMTSDHSHNQFSMYGESDERFKVKGGNSLIIKALEKELKPNIKQGYTLVQVEKKHDKSYLLTFLGGKETIIKADIVIFALPFTKLRDVNLKKANLLPTKLNAINHYQLGANGKVFLGFNSPFWQNQKSGKYLGNVFSDEFICGWDNSLLQNKSGAGYTIFYGGNQSQGIGKLDDNGLKNMFLPGMENVFQGAKEHFNDKIHRYHWQENSLSLGSYTCFAPGHYTEIMPHTQKTIDQLYFAGEHCSDAFQGFMNGAAQTGRDAAEAILKTLKEKEVNRKI
jgi:monoamine oxidase